MDKNILTGMVLDLGVDALVLAWNTACENLDYYDDRIMCMDDLDDLCSDMKATEIIGMLDRDFNVGDRFFYYDGYGDIVSIDDPMDGPIDVDALVDDMAENPGSYTYIDGLEGLEDDEDEEDDEDDVDEAV